MLSPQTVYNEIYSTLLFKITNDFSAPSQFTYEKSDDSFTPQPYEPGKYPNNIGNVEPGEGASKIKHKINLLKD